MDQTQTAPQPAEIAAPVDAPVELSIADHAASYGPDAQAETDEGDDAVSPHPSITQKRTDEGKWDSGRRRAKKDAASAGDVGRIGELTKNWRTAERERDELRSRLEALERERATPPSPVSAAVRPQAAKTEKAPSDDPRPDKTNATKYPDGQFDEQYFEDLADWKARQVVRSDREAAQKEATTRERGMAYAKRIDAAKTKYSDFEQVAFGPTTIPEGSPTDTFIMEDDDGIEVLYHLQKNPAELREILGKSALGQLKALSVLSHRLSSGQTPGLTAATGSVTQPVVVKTPPRPPNPVRTEAQRAGDTPPPTDGSLSVADHARQFGRR